MFRYKNLMTVCAAVVLAFGLAACGSSSDDDSADATPPVVTPDPMPPAPTPVAVEVADFMYLSGDQVPMAGTHDIAAGMTATSGGVTYLCAEGGDDCMVTVAEDGSATSTGGTATASLTAAGMMQVTDAKDATADDAEDARLVRVKQIIGEDRAIEGVSFLPRAATAMTLDAAEISISRADGAMARISVRSTADPTQAGYAPAEDMAMPNGDWTGARLARPIAGATQELVSYTDIDGPVREQFYNFDARSTTPSRYTDTGTAPTGANNNLVPYTSLNNPNTALAILGGTPVAGGFTGGVLDLTQFPTRGPSESGDVTKRFASNVDTDGNAANGPEEVQFPGNYNGAPGQYRCQPTGSTGAACTVTVTPAGTYTSGTDVWTFTPELGATAWRGDQELVSFGWWLQTPASPDGAYTFITYFDGTNYVAAGTPVGTATYSGRAAGRYAVQELGSPGVTDGQSGEFVAAASLMANFSSTANSVSGSITNFQGEMDGMTGWMVELKRINLGVTANLLNPFTTSVSSPSAATFNGATATMGDQTAHGTWGGQFLGNDMTGGESPMPVNGAFPKAVGGTFQADNEAVSIAGAFGARR